MATLSISVSGSTVVSGSKNYTITDADISDLLAWAQAAYAAQLPTAPTNPQIMLAWVQGWISGTKDSVLKFKQNAASQTAISGTTGINIV